MKQCKLLMHAAHHADLVCRMLEQAPSRKHCYGVRIYTAKDMPCYVAQFRPNGWRVFASRLIPA